MRRIAFVQIDVFTDKPFTGNQLTVFLDADGLTAVEMQALAREMNFSESTFVLPENRIRIFTPGREMPMAGHPVIGTALVLMEQGAIPGDHVHFTLNIGPVRIDLQPGFAWMTQPAAEFSEALLDRDNIAASLGLYPGDLHPGYPLQIVSTGVPYLLVPLISLEALSRARPGGGGSTCLYPFAVTESGLRARMFDPGPNEIPEDPATGSAAGPLAAYAARYGLRTEPEFVIEQGLEMGRPSAIHVRPQENGVMVGGTGVIVGRGEIFWP